MKTRVCVWVCAVVLAVSVAGFADEITDEYKKFMQPRRRDMALQRVMETVSPPQHHAGELQAIRLIENLYPAGPRGRIPFAKNVQLVAKEVQTPPPPANRKPPSRLPENWANAWLPLATGKACPRLVSAEIAAVSSAVERGALLARTWRT